MEYLRADKYCELVTDGTHDSPRRQEEGYYLITSKHIKGAEINFEEAYKISEDDYLKISQRSKVDQWDVLISMIGIYCGFAHIVTEEAPDFAVKNVGILKTGSKLKAQWLYYYLNSPEGKNYIDSVKAGSTQPYIALSELRKMPIPFPDIKTRESVCALLSAIDSKIYINNQINKNLEEQTQQIYKSWFVNYLPLGGVAPVEWEQKTLGEMCSCELGGTPSRTIPEYWNGDIPWINSGEVNNFRIIKPSEFITELGLKKSATKLLPAKTTVIAITGATLGQVSLLEIASCANQSVVGVVPNDNLPYEFLYPYIKSSIQELISHQTGGAQQHINKQNVGSLPLIVPSNDYLQNYKDTVKSLYASITNNCFENERLTELRDSLLPRLMSGELDVSEIEI